MSLSYAISHSPHLPSPNEPVTCDQSLSSSSVTSLVLLCLRAIIIAIIACHSWSSSSCVIPLCHLQRTNIICRKLFETKNHLSVIRNWFNSASYAERERRSSENESWWNRNIDHYSSCMADQSYFIVTVRLFFKDLFIFLFCYLHPPL